MYALTRTQTNTCRLEGKKNMGYDFIKEEDENKGNNVTKCWWFLKLSRPPRNHLNVFLMHEFQLR